MKVHLYSHVEYATGYGRAGRELAMALIGVGVELEIFPLGEPPANSHLLHAHGKDGQDLCSRYRKKDTASTPDVVIVHTLPLDCCRVLEHFRLVKSGGKHGPLLVVYSTWEAWSTPAQDVIDSWMKFDQLWYPSQPAWNLTCSTLTQHCIPHAFDPELDKFTDSSGWNGKRARTDDTFRFYYLGAWDVRKQPAALIRAFATTFTPADDVELVLHTVGMDRMNFHTQVATTGLEQEMLPKIRLSNEYLSDKQIAQFHANGDCFVTAARWEAFNLPAFDAMLAGKKVIATRDMGSDVFLFDTPAAHLVSSQLSPCAADVTAKMVEGGLKITVNKPQGLTCKALWREPDLSMIGKAMRGAFENRDYTAPHPPDHIRGFERATVGKDALRHLENR